LFHATDEALRPKVKSPKIELKPRTEAGPYSNYNASENPFRTLCFPSHIPCIAFLLSEQFSAQLATGAEAFPTLLTKFVTVTCEAAVARNL
jgi:hypothetical protein